MTELINIQGAPGTGKTRLLLNYYVKSCEIVGPERVAAITFTRAAADELRERCAAALGISGPPWTLRRRLPFVGTIHSLCLKLSDVDPKNLVDNTKLKQFDEKVGDNFRLPNIEDMEGWAYDEPTRRSEEVEVALWCRAAALHRICELEDVWELLDPDVALQVSFQRIRSIVESYEKWKEEHRYVDFEDLLLHGVSLQPPVRVVLADECQDNSPLLWAVINSWGRSESTATFVCAGDAFQALYAFAGGDPRLFSGRDGRWHVIRESHRFNDESAAYARSILAPVFGHDERFDQLTDWTGVGSTAPSADPTAFWLARTNMLVKLKAAQLQQAGEPYALIRGRAPLQTRAADAFRTLLRLDQGQMISKDEIAAIAQIEQVPHRKRAQEYPKTLPAAWYGTGTLEAAFGMPAAQLRACLPHLGYFTRIQATRGDDAIFQAPTLALGTIHCSPPGEMIATTTRGHIPIDDLGGDDRLISWHPDYHEAMRSKKGYTFERVQRLYRGQLITIRTNDSETTITPNHKLRVRYAPTALGKYLVYLFRKGNWWRVGQCEMLRTNGQSAGITRRMGNESADDAWIVRVCLTRDEACYWEAYYSIRYGIPLASFLATQGQKGRIGAEAWAKIFDDSAKAVGERISRLLEDDGLDIRYPYYTRNGGGLRSATRSFDLYAANLWPELFSVGVPKDGQVEWVPCTVDKKPYTGVVYDLSVTPYHYYFSGGALVHNSAKGKEAGSVTVCSNWATRPSQNLYSDEGRRAEACAAYVAASRHKHTFSLEPMTDAKGSVYPFPRRG